MKKSISIDKNYNTAKSRVTRRNFNTLLTYTIFKNKVKYYK
jgi:hypothetical protein